MAGNTPQTPSAIFPSAETIGLKTIGEYGSELNGQKLKYQTYSATNNQKINFAAPVKSKINYYNDEYDQIYALITFAEDIGIFKTNKYMAIGPISSDFDTNAIGSEVSKGQIVGTSSGSVANVVMNPEIVWGRVSLQGDSSPRPFVDFSLGNADENGDPVTNDPTGTGNTINVRQGVDVGSIAKSAAFSTFFQMPGIFNYAESNSLTGQRSLLNDQPLKPFIEQLCAACLRQFMSTPSGDFFAFYPDYFGGFGKAPYWIIEDIEIINGSIELSDDNLATHVYVVGDIVGPPSAAEGGGAGQINFLDRINTGGVVNIFNAFMADFLNGNVSGGTDGKVDSDKYPTLAQKEDAINFLRKYGARPYYEEQPAVRAPIYESFLAYQKFCLKWSEQFKTQFEFTFMPELFPGGIVAFPEHGLQCYVASVTHNCSYENGFTTSAELMAPAAYKNGTGEAVDPDKAWANAGMIRQWPKDGSEGKFKDATDEDPAAEDQENND